MKQKDSVWNILTPEIVKMIEMCGMFQQNEVEEIRMRKGKPLVIHAGGKKFFVPEKDKYKIVTEYDIRACVSRCSAYSLYAFEEEVRQGYLTIEGGHRIGFCGKVVTENGHIKTLQSISSLNIRIAKQIFGCADAVLPYILDKGRFCHTMLISPPACGKTTLLRELIRKLSEKGFTIGVADERGEISGMYQGVEQMDLGISTDVICGCDKAEGMELLLRSMSPEIIAVDELGKEADFEAVEQMLHGGVKLLCTVHGHDFADLQKRPVLKKILYADTIERFVFLSAKHGSGTVEYIQGNKGNVLYQI